MSTQTENSAEERKAVARSIFTDDWMAAKVRAEGATLQTLAEHFALDGVDVFNDELDGVYNTELIEDKEALRDLPFLITRWRFNASDKYKDDEGNDGVFVSVEIAYQQTPNGPVMTGVFNDGSTGVMAQLQKITANRLEKGLDWEAAHSGRGVRHGLRRSDYQRDTGKTDKNGAPITEAATTYYLNI